IRQAAKKMNMSYSKAHKMVKKMEKEIGGKLLKKQAGGSGGGGTGLTRRAGKLIEDYENMEKDIKKFAQKRFKKFKNQ
ncbi:MAG: LysR family transcriptional regulator, partial [Elusimicrobia bacterium]|nr:LysR family transcriptional regulator [Elusimicrobiota bacterium]